MQKLIWGFFVSASLTGAALGQSAMWRVCSDPEFINTPYFYYCLSHGLPKTRARKDECAEVAGALP